MIYEVTSAEIAPGKDEEAREWAKEIHNYSMKKWGYKGDTATQVTPGPGQGGRITWIAVHDSLVAWGKFHDESVQDAKWQELAKTFRKVCVPSTFMRTAYRTL